MAAQRTYVVIAVGSKWAKVQRHASVIWFFREVLCLMLCESLKDLGFN